MEASEWVEGVRAKGSCGEQEAGKLLDTLLLLSLPIDVNRCSTGGVGGNEIRSPAVITSSQAVYRSMLVL